MSRLRLLIPTLIGLIFIAGCPGLDKPGRLDELPAIAEAVVAPPEGRLYPSLSGPAGAVIVPEELFALSPTLVEIRRSMAPGMDIRATIRPGDRVTLLFRTPGQGDLCLVRTRFGTYGWVSSASLKITAGS